MKKLLDRYRASPTVDNLTAIMAYDRKHPFASILLVDDDLALFNRLCNYPTKPL